MATIADDKVVNSSISGDNSTTNASEVHLPMSFLLEGVYLSIEINAEEVSELVILTKNTDSVQ